MARIKTLFVDIGGVLLTNGWDHVSRRTAADKFKIDWEEYDSLHKQYYDIHETGGMTFDEYLTKTIFWKERPFTIEEFRKFAFNQSQLLPGMIDFLIDFKKEYGIRIATVSNEGRDLAEYRIRTFHLARLIDDFFVSCFVHYQKPNPRIYEIALDVTQARKDSLVYIDDRANLVEAAAALGIKGIVHKDLATTKQLLYSHHADERDPV